MIEVEDIYNDTETWLVSEIEEFHYKIEKLASVIQRRLR